MPHTILTTYRCRDNMSSQRIGRVLTRLREEKGYISEMEAGQSKNPGIETLKKIAKALGVPVTELLE